MIRAVMVASFCLLASAALAQTPKDAAKESQKAAPRPVPAAPERTTASFGDWVMHCETAGTPVRRVCEAAQSMTVQGQTAPVAQIAFGRASRSEPMRLTLVLPSNVTLGSKPRILVDKDDKTPVEPTWDRCIPGGCIASASVTDAMINRLSNAAEPGGIVFKDAAERDIAIPLSFRGLSQAIAALAKEP